MLNLYALRVRAGARSKTAQNTDRVQRARPGRPVVLRDGSQVLIRQVQPADAALLADGFARLSIQSRWLRFLTAKQELSLSDLRYLTQIDHHDHEAIGAVNRADGRGVGVARYIRDAGDPDAADVAVTVIDAWQRRGLASELLTRLSHRARQEGIRRFTALVLADNTAVMEILRRAGARLVHRGSDTFEYEVVLHP
jgi:RimJ/RimL family protein N-acetyltransferase